VAGGGCRDAHEAKRITCAGRPGPGRAMAARRDWLLDRVARRELPRAQVSSAGPLVEYGPEDPANTPDDDVVLVVITQQGSASLSSSSGRVSREDRSRDLP
jgi:hypothetical protein